MKRVHIGNVYPYVYIYIYIYINIKNYFIKLMTKNVI